MVGAIISINVDMQIVIIQGLLCVLIGATTAADTHLQSVTPRYNVNVENLNLEKSAFQADLLSETEIFFNSRYLPKVYETPKTVSQKLLTFLIPLIKSRKTRNINSSGEDNLHLWKNNKFKEYNNISKLKGTTSRPNIKRKSISSQLTKEVTIKKPNYSREHLLKITREANNSSNSDTIKKVHSQKKPLTSIKDITKLQAAHYKNYTKFRIKPWNKQINRINPEIITYSPTVNNPLPILSEINSYQSYSQVSTSLPEYSIGSGSTNAQKFSSYASFNQSSIPVSQVILHSSSIDNTGTKDTLAYDCPSFSISSNIFGPQRQDCSDLDIVINSHLNQNIIPETVPEVQPLASEIQTVEADEPIVNEPDQGAASISDAPASAAAPAPSPSQSTTGGSQGGGLPQLPELPQLEIPDLKGLFDILSVIWRVVSSIFGFLTNPYLYLVPAGISFIVGFLKIAAAFKLFIVIPALLLFGYVNRDKPPEVAYYKHIYKPVHHYNGWFWNYNSKMWQNIVQYVHSNPLQPINKFEFKYKKHV